MTREDIQVGKWLAAALDDVHVCNSMKKDINKWFSQFPDRSRDYHEFSYIRGYLAAVREGRAIQSLFTDYGFGPKGLGIYIYKENRAGIKLMAFISESRLTG